MRALVGAKGLDLARVGLCRLGSQRTEALLMMLIMMDDDDDALRERFLEEVSHMMVIGSTGPYGQ